MGMCQNTHMKSDIHSYVYLFRGAVYKFMDHLEHVSPSFTQVART